MPLGMFQHSLNLAQPSTPPPSGITMSFVTSQTFTTTSFVIPAASQAGDIAILFDHSSSTTNTVPSGWTSITGVSTTGIRQNISRKILTSGDLSGNLISGMGSNPRKIVLVYRPSQAITSVTATVTGSQATTSSIQPSNQTLTGEAGPMIAFACYSSSGAISNRGWSVGSPTEYSVISTSTNYVKALITNTGTPSTTTISMTGGFNNALQSFRLKFA